MTYVVIWLVIFVVFEAVSLFIYKESAGFKVTTYNLNVNKKLPKPLRLVMISDLHDTDLGNENDALIQKIDEINPDFVLIAGDMVTSYMQPGYNHKASFAFLRKLASKYKVYYGLGNHEQRYLDEPDKFKGKFLELKDFLLSLSIELLMDESIDIDEYNTTIYGLMVPLEHYRRVVTKKLPDEYLKKVFGENNPERLNILIAHTPDQFDIYENWKPDIVVSGHVHGGIIGVPKLGGLLSPQLKLFPKYDAGLFEKNETTMILGRGIGWHTIPIRIFNKAELVEIIISSKQ